MDRPVAVVQAKRHEVNTMNIPGFTAEASLSPTVQKYAGRSHHGAFSAEPVSPQQLEYLSEVLEDEIGDGELSEQDLLEEEMAMVEAGEEELPAVPNGEMIEEELIADTSEEIIAEEEVITEGA